MAVIAIHPGEHLAEELNDLGMSAAELARKLDVPTNRITAILNGRRSVTEDTALRLAHFFGTSAEFWINLQSTCDLRVAQEKVGNSLRGLPRLKRTERIHAYGCELPLSEWRIRFCRHRTERGAYSRMPAVPGTVAPLIRDLYS